MKTSVCKAFSFIFAEEATIAENNVINFISRTFSIQSMPFFLWLLAFSIRHKQNKQTNKSIKTIEEKQIFRKQKIWNACIQMKKKKMEWKPKWTCVEFPYCPLDVCKIRVTSVLAPGHVQLFASNAYLNSSSHTTCSANFTCSLCSGLATVWMK